MTDRFAIFWSWTPRNRTAQEIQDRLADSVRALSSLDPAFRDWRVTDFMDALAGRAGKKPTPKNAAMGEPGPGNGFMVVAARDFFDWPEGMSLLCANAVRASALGKCGVTFMTAETGTPDEIASYAGLKAITMALVPIWEASFAQVYPMALRPQGSGTGGIFGPSWMTYLDAELAKAIEPPAGILAESAGGGVLLSATQEPFDVGNPAHRASSDALLAALAPIGR